MPTRNSLLTCIHRSVFSDAKASDLCKSNLTPPLVFGSAFLWSNGDVGGLAELADAEVSKTSESNLISVRFRYPPPSSVFPNNQCKRFPQVISRGRG